jgi:twitching motility protein PilT
MEFHDMLNLMVKERASDLFIKVGSPPTLRIDGKIRFVQAEAVTPEEVEKIAATMKRSKPHSLDDASELDIAYDVPTIGRFRANIYKQRGYTSFVLRHVEKHIPGFEQLELPQEPFGKLGSLSRGLVLVTGVTGCGKSTTLAALVNYINENYNKHIITLEDPIEFVFRDKRSIVSQREIGIDTSDFHTALKHVVRESPDVIMIGEMRDRETMEAAITAAETGHLVFSSLHTVNAIQTVERIINYFPPHQHNLIRLQLSMVLEGVASQRLLVRKDGQGRVLEGVASQRLLVRKDGQGRVPAVELMMKSPTIRDLLMDGKTTELYKAIKEGEYFGSQTFNQSLKKLYEREMITLEEAMLAADNPDELKLEIRGIMKGSRAADFDFDY